MDSAPELITQITQFLSELDPTTFYEGGAALALMFGTLFFYFRGRRIEREQVEAHQERLRELEQQIIAEVRKQEAEPKHPETVPEAMPTPVSEPIATAVAEAPREQIQESKVAVSAGLKKSRSAFFGKLRSLFGSKSDLNEILSQFEEVLITSDLGVRTTQTVLARIEERVKSGGSLDEEVVADELRSLLNEILRSNKPAGIRAEKVGSAPKVILVVGVNGVGKTTTIGKLSTLFREQGARVLVGACDTFRAAAVEQLDIWAQRSGVDIERGLDGAKPSTVAYQSAERAVAGGYDVLIVDTAGRLHTRVNLMNELASVVSVIEQKIPGAPHETLLVLDAVTGQNGLQQAREFHDKAKLTGVVVTKLDGTPKGGIVVAIKQELGIPIRYIGVGEQIHDLREFSATEFVEGLLNRDDVNAEDQDGVAAGGERPRVRRRRQEVAGNGA